MEQQATKLIMKRFLDSTSNILVPEQLTDRMNWMREY